MRTERPRKTKVDHVTRDSDTTFKVKRSKVKVTRPLSVETRSGMLGVLHNSRSYPDLGNILIHVIALLTAVGAPGGCSGGRGNVLAVGNCCYVSVCSAALGASAPTGGGDERGHIVAAARLRLVLV